MKLIKRVGIRLLKEREISPIEFVQYDTGIQLEFEYLDFDIPSGTVATLYVRKKSGKFVYQENGISIIGNVVSVDLENQAITEKGEAFYQLELINGKDTISTFSNKMWIKESYKNADATESTTVISTFSAKTAEEIAKIQESAAAVKEDVISEGSRQVDAIKKEGESQQSAIEAKGKETLDTIPPDYTDMYNMAEEAMRTKADAIAVDAEGEAISVTNASDDPLHSLRIFGKTTQAGVPSPDSPQELVSVENPSVTINGSGEESQILSIQHVLTGIPVTTGGNYTDSNGQQWLADEIVYDYLNNRWQYVQNCFKTKLVDFANAKVTAPSNGFTEGYLNCGIMTKAKTAGLCDKFVFIVSGDVVRFATAGAMVYFTLKGELTAAEWIKRMEEISPTVLTPREDPIITELTTEEVLAFKALRTNKPNTVIVNDAGAHMAVEYAADTEIFLRECQPEPDAEKVQAAVNAYLDEHGIELPDVAEDVVSLPVGADGTPDHGSVGQFAVSDGKGGITWITVVDGNGVAY